LVIHGGVLYEGTGKLGRSSLRRVDMESGDILQQRALPNTLFGEGVAVVDDRIVQLTWHSQTGLVYDRVSFEPLRTFNYPTEGWGLTYDGQQLIMSDGTSTLYFLDPDTFERTHQVEVFDERGPLTRLNELEYVQGEIFANVWYQNSIARIDPQTGRVTGWIDLTGLLRPEVLTKPADILNGIAYDADSDRLFVTGKLWPKLFEIELVPQE
jgi:glutamine cyclotransferase